MRSSRRARGCLTALGVVVVLALALLLLRQPLGRLAVHLGLGYLARNYGVQVSYDELQGDIFSSPRFRELKVLLGRDSLTARELVFSYDLIGLVRGRFSLSEVDVDGLTVYLGTGPVDTTGTPEDTARGPLRYPRASLGRLTLTGGRLFLNDTLRVDSLAVRLGMVSSSEQLVVLLDDARLVLPREQVKVNRLTARCRMTPDSLVVSRLELATPASRLKGSMAMEFDSTGIAAVVDSLSLDLAEFTGFPGRVRAAGSGGFEGGRPTGRLDYRADGLRFAHLELPPIQGDAGLKDGRLAFSLAGSDELLGRFSVEGEVGIEDLVFRGRAELRNTSVSAIGPGLPDIRVQVDIGLSGRGADSVEVTAEGQVPALGIESLSVAGRYLRGDVEVSECEIRQPGGWLWVSGAYRAGRVVGRCAVDGFDLSLLDRAGLAEGVGGRLEGVFNVAGNADSITAAGGLRVTGLRVGDIEVARAVAEFDLGVGERISGRLVLGGEQVGNGALALEAAQFVMLDSDFDLRVDRAQDRLVALGTVGFLSRAGLECEVGMFEYAAGEETLRLSRPFGVRWQGDTVAVSGLVYEVAGGTLSLEAVLAGAGPPSVEARGRDIDLNKLAELGRLPVEPDGSLDFDLSGAGSYALRLAARDVAVPSIDLALKNLEMSAVLSETGAVVDSLAFVHREDTTVLSGEVFYRTEDGLSVDSVDIRADIRDPGAWVLGFLKQTVHLQDGMIYGLLSMQGGIDEPNVDGRLRIVRGTVFVPAVNATIERVSAEFTADGDRIELRKLTGGAGRGIVTVAGFVDLGKAWMAESLRYRILPDGAVMSPMPEVYAVVGGDVTISWAENEPFSIAGDIDVEEALLAFGFGQSSATGPPAGNGDDSLVYDIRVRGDRGIWFRNDMLDIELSVDLTLHKTMTTETYSGQLATRQGNVYYLDHTLRVTRGVIGFDNIDRINPTLDIAAELPVRSAVGTAEDLPEKIVLRLGGTLERPEFRFSSDPAGWDENEIITYLSLNVTTSELSALENREAVARYLSERFLGYLQTRGSKWVRKYIGLDELRLESELAGGEGYKVTVGKYVGRNIYVTYTQNFTGELQPEFAVEYYFDRRNEIVGARSEEGRYSLQYRFRLRY